MTPLSFRRFRRYGTKLCSVSHLMKFALLLGLFGCASTLHPGQGPTFRLAVKVRGSFDASDLTPLKILILTSIRRGGRSRNSAESSPT